jgi:hypothetical protein
VDEHYDGDRGEMDALGYALAAGAIPARSSPSAIGQSDSDLPRSLAQPSGAANASWSA